MTLKSPAYKIQSSFATFEFSNKELIYIRDTYPWQLIIQHFPEPTGNSVSQYHQLIEQTRIAVFSYHIEFLQESLSEFIKNPVENWSLTTENKNSLDELQTFLFCLRNALLHAKGELVPQWKFDFTKISKTKASKIRTLENKNLTIKIPVQKHGNNVRFDKKSNSSEILTFTLNPNQDNYPFIILSETFFQEIRLLSWHILTITKKKKASTLSRYLDRTS
jgi:hypothetical protein